jgi:3'-phosphoadenosine 5'-phosphosulfate sulfotransferase (PAPS reductase)/FAD synthetase
LGVEHARVFLDTGWEHPLTYEYLRGELTRVLGPIEEVRGPHDMVSLLRRKRMFPSRVRRFCTQELKVHPMREHLRALQDSGVEPINAVGIRRGESAARSTAAEWEWSDTFDCEVWRPMVDWSVADVMSIHQRHGLQLNPLYLQGASRVGCWPCIYSRKGEIRHLAETDPERVALLRTLESELTERAGAPRTWFHAPPHVAAGGLQPMSIDEVVEWSRSTPGGRKVELFASTHGDSGCMRWGLCSTDEE